MTTQDGIDNGDIHALIDRLVDAIRTRISIG